MRKVVIALTAWASLVMHFAASAQSLEVGAAVENVYDGDTINVVAEIWPDLHWDGGVRLRGVDTPEIRGECQEEKDAAYAARDYVRSLVEEGDTIYLHDVDEDKYHGRVVASVYLDDGTDLAQLLIDEGFGVPYDGSTRQDWCAEP